MPSSVVDIFFLAGALALMLFGTKYMAEGLQKALGMQLRHAFYQFRGRKIRGLTGGALVSMGLQSSASTLVLLLSLVNGGLIQLLHTVPIMLGALLGASMSAWLLAYLEFDWQISSISLPLLGICFPLLFFGRERLRYIGEFLVGLTLILLGIYFLRDAVPYLREYPAYVAFMDDYVNIGPGSVLMFALAGALIGVLLQSTTAVLALTMALLTTGWIDFGVATALILGENIGTAVTLQMAGLSANVDARRMAFIFSLIALGVLMLALASFNLLLEGANDLVCAVNRLPELHLIDGYRNDLYRWGAYGLATVHTIVHGATVLIFLALSQPLEQLSRRMVRRLHKWDHRSHLQYLHTNLLQTPEIAVVEAQKEILDYATHAQEMFLLVEALVLNLSEKSKKDFKRLRKYEDESDRLEVEIARYLSKLSTQNLSHHTSRQIKAMWSIINDLERIADQCEQLGRLVEKRSLLKIEFNQDAEEEIRSMFQAVNEAFALMNRNMRYREHRTVDMTQVFEIENHINNLRNELRDSHFIRLETGKCSMQSGLIYLDLIASLEKVADQIVSVQEAATHLR